LAQLTVAADGQWMAAQAVDRLKATALLHPQPMPGTGRSINR